MTFWYYFIRLVNGQPSNWPTEYNMFLNFIIKQNSTLYQHRLIFAKNFLLFLFRYYRGAGVGKKWVLSKSTFSVVLVRFTTALDCNLRLSENFFISFTSFSYHKDKYMFNKSLYVFIRRSKHLKIFFQNEEAFQFQFIYRAKKCFDQNIIYFLFSYVTCDDNEYRNVEN